MVNLFKTRLILEKSPLKSNYCYVFSSWKFGFKYVFKTL